jgi:hypothetical protein
MQQLFTRRLPLPEGLRQWIINHDDSWIFILLYIGLAVVLSIWISLFWLLAVVAAHFVLEWIRQSHLRPHWRATLAEVLWELKLDIGLVFFALALSLYMQIILGLVGLQSAARLGVAVRGGARFAAWERTLRGILLSVDDAAQVVRAVTVNRGRNAASTLEADVSPPVTHVSSWGSWQGQWGTGDWIAVGLNLICLFLILTAPLLTEHTYASVLATMLNELQPFPLGDGAMTYE